MPFICTPSAMRTVSFTLSFCFAPYSPMSDFMETTLVSCNWLLPKGEVSPVGSLQSSFIHDAAPKEMTSAMMASFRYLILFIFLKCGFRIYTLC